MAQAANKLANELASRTRGLEAYVARMERLAVSGHLSRPDLHKVYAGAYLSFYTYVERSIERLFLGLIMKDLRIKGAQPLVEIRSYKVARAVIHGDRKYVDWLPFDRFTSPRAAAFLSRGEPFATVPKSDLQILGDLGVLRNAIAHESIHALKSFNRRFTEGKALPPVQRRPSGYLRGQHAVGVTRLTHLLSETVAVFHRMCSDA